MSNNFDFIDEEKNENDDSNKVTIESLKSEYKDIKELQKVAKESKNDVEYIELRIEEEKILLPKKITVW